MPGLGKFLTIALIAAMLPAPAMASLGAGRDSVAIDRTRIKARGLVVARTAHHTAHTLTLANGGTVRELVAADGTVFAISWNGPGRPDLRTLLGPHFAALAADQTPVRMLNGRRVLLRRALAVSRADLVITSGGHPGAYWGMAYLPLVAPPGFDPALAGAL